MLNKLQKLREGREQGFTLIELLVVILIIGILAAIAIPAFLNQRKSAVDASVESDVTNAAKVVETEAIKGKGMPLSVSGDTSLGEPLMVGSEDITEQVKKGKDADLKLEGNTNGYVITGTNDGGTDEGAKAGIVYDSANGGLAKAGTAQPGGEETGGTFTASGNVYTGTPDSNTSSDVTYTLSFDKQTLMGTVKFSDSSLDGRFISIQAITNGNNELWGGNVENDEAPFEAGGQPDIDNTYSNIKVILREDF